MVTSMLFLLGAHYIADFPLQSDFIARLKGKRIYILFAHAMIYATIISLVLLYLGKYTDWKFFVILLSHMLIDWWKARQPSDDAHWHLLYYDQIGHIVINALLYFV